MDTRFFLLWIPLLFLLETPIIRGFLRVPAASQEGGFGGCSCTPKTGTRTPKTGARVQKTERRYIKPERGHIRQNRPFTQPPFCFLSSFLRFPRESAVFKCACWRRSLESAKINKNQRNPAFGTGLSSYTPESCLCLKERRTG